MSSAAVVFAVLAGGVATAGLALRRWGWRGLPLALGALTLAPALGYGSASLAVFAWSWSGRPGGRPALVAIAVGLAALLVALTPRRPRRPAPERAGLPRSLAFALVAAGAVSLAGVTAAAPLLVRAQPLGRHDAHAIWNVHAAFLFRAPGDPSPLFRDMRLGHPDYPLLLPGAIAAHWSLLGREDAAIPQTVGVVFLLATALTIGSALGARGSPQLGCLAVALYLSTPNALRWGFAQCADVPLSYLLALAAVGCTGLIGRERDGPLPPALGGFCLGLLAWTKNEGMILAALVCGWLVLLSWTSGGNGIRRRSWAELAAGAALPLLALVLFKLHWSPRNEIAEVYLRGAADRVADLNRWHAVAAVFRAKFDPLLGWRYWGAVWPFALLGCLWALCIRGRRLAASRGPAWIVASALVAWFIVYVAGSPKLGWQLRTSADRLLLQLLPLALIGAWSGRGRGSEPQ